MGTRSGSDDVDKSNAMFSLAAVHTNWKSGGRGRDDSGA